MFIFLTFEIERIIYRIYIYTDQISKYRLDFGIQEEEVQTFKKMTDTVILSNESKLPISFTFSFESSNNYKVEIIPRDGVVEKVFIFIVLNWKFVQSILIIHSNRASTWRLPSYFSKQWLSTNTSSFKQVHISNFLFIGLPINGFTRGQKRKERNQIIQNSSVFLLDEQIDIQCARSGVWTNQLRGSDWLGFIWNRVQS